MRTIYAAVAAFVMLSCTPQAEVDGTLIWNVTLISPDRESPAAGAWVLIEHDRIAQVGTGEPGFRASTVIDGSGRYLIPGLIDGHVHLEGVPGFDFPIPEDLRHLAELYYAQLPRSYLYFGFTTIIDLNVLTRVQDASIGAVDCFRVKGTHPRGGPVTIWVDKGTFLIRRIDSTKEFDDFHTIQTTLYEPRINKEITEDALAFDAPRDR